MLPSRYSKFATHQRLSYWESPKAFSNYLIESIGPCTRVDCFVASSSPPSFPKNLNLVTFSTKETKVLDLNKLFKFNTTTQSTKNQDIPPKSFIGKSSNTFPDRHNSLLVYQNSIYLSIDTPSSVTLGVDVKYIDKSFQNRMGGKISLSSLSCDRYSRSFSHPQLVKPFPMTFGLSLSDFKRLNLPEKQLDLRKNITFSPLIKFSIPLPLFHFNLNPQSLSQSQLAILCSEITEYFDLLTLETHFKNRVKCSGVDSVTCPDSRQSSIYHSSISGFFSGYSVSQVLFDQLLPNLSELKYTFYCIIEFDCQSPIGLSGKFKTAYSSGKSQICLIIDRETCTSIESIPQLENF